MEKLVPVIDVTKNPGRTVSIRLKLGTSGVRVGDSVCVNGVCLTVSGKKGSVLSFDVMEETLHVTNLGDLTENSKVNIEKSLRLTDVVGGHFVTGHIDGTGRIAQIQKLSDGSVREVIETKENLTAMMLRKGSVAVDGISLTLVDIQKNNFSVCLIPHTLSATTLGYKAVGATVNIEADMLGKYVRNAVEKMSVLDH